MKKIFEAWENFLDQDDSEIRNRLHNLSSIEKLNVFKKASKELDIADYNELAKYIFNNKIASGSYRTVYPIGKYRVLKIVDPMFSSDLEDSISENKKESDLYLQKNLTTIIPKVFDAADDFSWIVLERVLPIMKKSKNERVEIYANSLPYIYTFFNDRYHKYRGKHFLMFTNHMATFLKYHKYISKFSDKEK